MRSAQVLVQNCIVYGNMTNWIPTPDVRVEYTNLAGTIPNGNKNIAVDPMFLPSGYRLGFGSLCTDNALAKPPLPTGMRASADYGRDVRNLQRGYDGTLNAVTGWDRGAHGLLTLSGKATMNATDMFDLQGPAGAFATVRYSPGPLPNDPVATSPMGHEYLSPGHLLLGTTTTAGNNLVMMPLGSGLPAGTYTFQALHSTASWSIWGNPFEVVVQ